MEKKRILRSEFKKISCFLFALMMIVTILPINQMTVYAASATETLSTVGDVEFTGTHFKVTGHNTARGGLTTYGLNSDGIRVEYGRGPVTIETLNNEFIEKVELTVGFYSYCCGYVTATKGTLSGNTKNSQKIVVSDVDSTSVDINITSNQVEFSSVTVTYTSKISKADSANGSFTITDSDDSEVTYADEGAELTITPLANAGYDIYKVGYRYNVGNSYVEVDKNANGKYVFTIPANSITVAVVFHKTGNYTKIDGQSPTCTESGWKDYYLCNCGCQLYFSDENLQNFIENINSWKTGEGKIEATGHSYGEPTYTWSADGMTCTATRICTNDASHVETETVTSEPEVKTAATCTIEGTTTYTATFTNSAFSTQTKDVVDIEAIGHSYGEPTYTWSADGMICTATRICTNDASHVETETATITPAVKTAATCTTEGTTTYTATFTNSAFSTQTKDVVDIEAIGHFYGEPTYTWSADGMTCTATRICTNDTSHVETETVTSEPEVKTAATCTTEGTTTYTATFTNSAFNTQTKDVVDIVATGHTLTKVAAKAATTTSTGNKEYYKCTVCGSLFLGSEGKTEISLSDVTIAKLQPVYGEITYSWSADGKTCTAQRVCTNDSSATVTEEVKVTSKVTEAASCTAKGSTTYTATFKNTIFTTQTKTLKDINAKGHKLTKVAAKKATTTSTGNKAYYKCSTCGKLYLDSAGKTKTTLAKVTIAKLAKATNPMKLKAASKTLKYTSLKKKAVSYTITFSKKAQGKVTYTLSKAAKNAGIKVSSKGKITIPKNCKKGTYKITIKAAGNSKYKAASKTFTVVVK